MTPKKLWGWLAFVIIASFAVLIFYGVDIYRKVPPIPEKVVTTDGKVLYTGQDVKDGQNVWQSIGGQTVGSIWGHGAYIAPDWTADYLHRESTLLLDELAKKDGTGSDPRIRSGGDGRREASSAVTQPIPEKPAGAPGRVLFSL